MSLLFQIGILVLSVYLLAKGVEIKVKGARNPETDSARNRRLALSLVVLGLAIGFAGGWDGVDSASLWTLSRIRLTGAYQI